MQPRQGSLNISPGSTPKDFGRSSGPGPDNRIDIVGGGLFRPQELLTAEDETPLGFSDVSIRIKRVSLGVCVSGSAGGGVRAPYLLPALEWVAPAVSSCIVTKPCSGTTILANGQLPRIRREMNCNERGKSSQREREQS